MSPRTNPCTVCGEPVPYGSEPVTLSGWYAGHQLVWDAGRLREIDTRCPLHPDLPDGAGGSSEEG